MSDRGTIPVCVVTIDGMEVEVIPKAFESRYGIASDLDLRKGLVAYLGGGTIGDICHIAGFNDHHPENKMDYAVPSDHPLYGSSAITVYHHDSLEDGVCSLDDVLEVVRLKINEAITEGRYYVRELS